jgi:hypothetical protein
VDLEKGAMARGAVVLEMVRQQAAVENSSQGGQAALDSDDQILQVGA